MTPRLITARHVRDYTIHLCFANGVEGDLDLSGELSGPVFEPLNDPDRFREFSIHPELHTLVWPNGADLAPEFLYDSVRVAV